MCVCVCSCTYRCMYADTYTYMYTDTHHTWILTIWNGCAHGKRAAASTPIIFMIFGRFTRS
jgi:hypothetical protein